MATPNIIQVDPIIGHTRGGEPIRIYGEGFGTNVLVRFGEIEAKARAVLNTANGNQVLHVLTPKHPESVVDVTLINLDTNAQLIPGERTTVSNAFRFMRSRISAESTLVRVVRAFISSLQHQLKGFVTAPVSTQWGEVHWVDGELQVHTDAQTPALIVEGPMLGRNSNPALSSVVRTERLVRDESGAIVVQYGWPSIRDLEFTLGGVSTSTVQLLNMEHALVTYFDANPLLQVATDSAQERYHQRLVSNLSTELTGPDNLRSFVVTARIAGVVLDQGAPVSTTGMLADGPEVTIQPQNPKEHTP